jgi:hypothetical protein
MKKIKRCEDEDMDSEDIKPTDFSRCLGWYLSYRT